jgi:hypothetical protein
LTFSWAKYSTADEVDGVVRQASFLGLRDDKDPADVVREG